MAGLLGSISGLSSSALTGFITGKSAATTLGQVEQFRNSLRYDYGEILSGAASDGTIFDIRINAKDDYEFGPNLSFRGSNRLPTGVVDTGDSLAMQTSIPRMRLEQHDVSRVAFALLLASKGEIDEDALNDNPAYGARNNLSQIDAFDRLNIDTERSFRVNDVKFEIADGRVRIEGRPGAKAQASAPRDNDIERLRKKLEQARETLPGEGEMEKVDAAGKSIVELVSVRDDLESRYTFVAYDFTESQFVGSDNFSEIMGALATVPDGYFFGANVAMQLEQAVGDDISQTAKNEIFPAVINYFSGLLLGAMTGLPAQLRSEFEGHSRALLENVYGEGSAKVDEILDTIRPHFENTADAVLDSVADIPLGADLDAVREALGISVSGSTYSVRKFAFSFA